MLTQASVHFHRDRREVRLRTGQILFTVAPDATKPFDVLADNTRVRVIGTQFSVRHLPAGALPGKVEVRVAEGRVEVSGKTADGPMTRLVALVAGQASPWAAKACPAVSRRSRRTKSRSGTRDA